MKLTAAIISALILSTLAAVAEGPVDGDWRVTDGPVISFRADALVPGAYDIVWLDGERLDLAPGTAIGRAVASPTPGLYDCTVSIDPRGANSRKKRSARFTVRVDADDPDTFYFQGYDKGMRFNLFALLPYWYRRPVRQIDNRPERLDGGRRVGAPDQYIEL